MKLALTAALLLLVAGCGSSGLTYGSASDVATAADCASTKDLANADLELFVTNAVDCGVNGHTVTINWFKTTDALKTYRKTADSFGGSGLAYGKNWAVECHDDQADCDAVVAAVKN